MSQPDTSDDNQSVKHDLLCVHCHYNLRTRSLADRCPGCGLQVARSADFDRSQPRLADGCRALAMAALVMASLGALNFVVHLLSNLTGQLLGRAVWVRVFDPTLAVVRIVDMGLLILAVICMARSGLSPPVLRRRMPLSGLLVMGLAGIVLTTLVVAAINIVEFQLGGRITFTLFRTRHVFFLLQTLTHVPLFICGWLFFHNLTRRPELAGFRAWVLVIFCMNVLFWLIYAAIEINFLMAFFVTLREPPEQVYNLIRMVEWVQLTGVLPEMLFWGLLARRARELAK